MSDTGIDRGLMGVAVKGVNAGCRGAAVVEAAIAGVIIGVWATFVAFEGSPCVSSCSGLRRACISGSAKTRYLCSVFLFLNQLMISCSLCCVV